MKPLPQVAGSRDRTNVSSSMELSKKILARETGWYYRKILCQSSPKSLKVLEESIASLETGSE